MKNKRPIAVLLISSILTGYLPAYSLAQQAMSPVPISAPGAVLFQQPIAPMQPGLPAGNTPNVELPAQAGGAGGGVNPLGVVSPLDYALASSTAIDDYLLGPGDQLGVHIIVGDNALNLDYMFRVSLAGTIFFPAVGEIQVAGRKLAQFKNYLKKKIQAKFPEKFEVSVILEDVRKIQVFVFGHVENPGPIVTSGLSTVAQVIKYAGISRGGSERFVTIKHVSGDELTVDLYAYFRKGDISANVLLQTGDRLEVPAVGDLDRVEGQVNRPGAYEIQPGETVQDLIDYAGGMTKFAIWEQAALLNRVKERKLVNLRLNETLADGDLLYIPGKNIKVQIIGEVEKPGLYDLYAGQTLLDLIKVSGGLKKSGALQEVVYLTRKIGGDTFVDKKLNVYKLVYEGDESNNAKLEDGDVVTIPSISLYVYVYGAVGLPGRQAYIPGQKLSDYLNLAGGPSDKANLVGTTVSRFEEGRSRVFRVNASDILQGGRKDRDIDLKGGDVVYVPGKFFYFSDFNSLTNLVITAATMYGIFFRR